MTEHDMIDGLFPHPVEDSDGDGMITLKEKVFYYLKMIPWTVGALLFPVLSHAVKTGVANLLPIAVNLATELAQDAVIGALTGEEKATHFNDRMKEAAIAEGKELATSELNWLRENAVQIIKGQ